MRGSLANGFGGAAGNVAATALDPNADHSLQGYASAAGRGFVVSGAGSFVAGKAGPAYGARVATEHPELNKVVSKIARHAAPRNVAGILDEQFADRTIGAATSMANVLLEPGASEAKAVLEAIIEGAANGGGGPTSGLHARASVRMRSMHGQTQSSEEC